VQKFETGPTVDAQKRVRGTTGLPGPGRAAVRGCANGSVCTTALQTLVLIQLTELRAFVVPLVLHSGGAPIRVTRILPLLPTATQKLVFTQLTPRRF